MASSAARTKTESHITVLVGIVALALLVIGMGIWLWRASPPMASYSELFWSSSPRLQGDAVQLSVQLHSSESQAVRVDVNVYFDDALAQRKIIQLEQGQRKQIDFSIPVEDAFSGAVEVRVVAQRFDARGNSLRSNLEIRDWLRVN